MLPDLENCDEAESTETRSSKNGGNSDGSRIQSSLSKRAISTRRSLKELSEGVQQRFHPHPNLLRINEDDSPPTPIAPPRLNRNAYQKYVEPCSATTTPHNSPTVQAPGRSTSVSSESRNSDWSQSVKRIDNALNRNYYTIAYSIVIIAYLAGFTEYLYFRLASILTPEHLIFHPPCEGKSSRKINKDGFHYGVSICAFIGVAIFQLLCFFALTISENWTRVKENPGDCRLAAQREEFAQFVRQMISKTMYRVFICYAVCSLINCSIIFYMVGIQDSLGDTVSTVLLYVFDAVVILYFVAFPLTTVIYHPYIQCFKPSSYPPAQIILGGSATRTQTSTLETTISAFNETTTTTTPTTKPTNFARHDPRRQNMAHRTATTTTLPVLEEYLHSPRRATATASFQPPSPVPLPIVTTMAPTPTLTHRPIGRDEEATEEEESAASQRLTTFV